jgi:glycosyltransferase involved in cell wall biosynthesis
VSTSVVLGRLGVLSKTVLGHDPRAGSIDEYLGLLAPAIEGDTHLLWLSHAAISAVFPLHDEFERFRRDQALNGALPALQKLVSKAKRPLSPNRSVGIRIAHDTVIVDVHHTARTGLATGIQRVVRQTILEWQAKPEVELVGWDANFTGLRHLSAPERENALHGSVPRIARPREWVLTIPYGTTYILPELAIEQGRTDRLSCLAEFSGNRTMVIGFDCVPLTSSETVGAGMSAAFANNLSALAHFDRISTISNAAATEYRGWKQMLAGAGLTGPEIVPLLLPSVAEEVSAADFEVARARLVTGDAPLVVCVGSHEPRKNHLAVLYAAERLWREGVEFQLVFIGGNGWNGDAFRRQLERLEADGRPVKAISAVSDSLLWSAYRLAYLTVFPSLNEGFGLPVGESLAAGTPVVTSDFGSMKEIAIGGGAIFVDPRDDDNIYEGFKSGLGDAELHARLVAETALLSDRGWSDYADSLWQYFVPTGQPSGAAL